MANKFYNEQIHGTAPPGGGRKPASGESGTSGFKVKQSWATGLPGKSGPNRSNGVKKAKIYPASEGL